MATKVGRATMVRGHWKTLLAQVVLALGAAVAIADERPPVRLAQATDRPAVVTERDAIVKMMNAYVEAFSRSAQEAAVFLDEPFVAVGPRGATVAKTRAEAEAIYANVLHGLKSKGFQRAAYADLRVKMLTTATALVTGEATRFNTEGKEYEKAAATYLLRKTSDGWRITILTTQPPGTVVLAPE
jgi:hypothetical protein